MTEKKTTADENNTKLSAKKSRPATAGSRLGGPFKAGSFDENSTKPKKKYKTVARNSCCSRFLDQY